jgi:hypothetical protein
MMFRGLSEWYRNRRRGEVRIAPRGVRGRVLAKKNPSGESGELMAPVKARPKGTMKMKVIRTDGSIEYYDANDVTLTPITRRRRR